MQWAERLAAAWADAVRGTSFVPLDPGELEALLRGLAGELLAGGPDAAARVGRALVDAHFTEPASLRATVTTVGAQLAGEPVPAALGALAAGYAQALQERTRAEQEGITSAALTALRQAEDARWDSAARYRAVFADAHIGIGLSSVDGRILEVNRAMCQMFGLTPEEFRARSVSTFTHPSDDPAFWRRLADLVAGKVDRLRMEKANYRADGSEIWTDLVLSLVRDASGGPAFMIGMVEDITERRLLEQRLRHQAGHDPLTGLPNRATAYARLVEDLRAGRPVGVCYLDLDGFKRVNDTLGHCAGDELLCVIAGRLRDGLAGAGHVARMGGDEFIIFVPGGTPEATEEVARRALDLVRDPVRLDGQSVAVSASAGVATPGHVAARGERAADDPAAELLKAADRTLLWAKNDGRARYTVYDRGRHREERHRRELADQIPQALRTNAIEAHYQPLFRLADGRVCGVEALARWRRADGTLLLPAAFVALAEETGAGGALGEHILRAACRDAARLASPLPFVVSVNVTAQQVHEPSLEALVVEVLDQTGWTAAALQLELTESDLMETEGRPLKTLTALAERGVSIAIDDFGTGYSNLAYLHSLPVTVVKLAGPFVANPINTRLLDAVITMAHALGLVVTAEALETAEQVAVLRELGCDLGQGFHLGGVGPPETLGQLLTGAGPWPAA